MRLISRLTAIISAEKDAERYRPKVIPFRRVAAAKIGRGFEDPRQRAGTKRIAITVDDATFERVRERAVARNISFAAAARELIERACDMPERNQ